MQEALRLSSYKKLTEATIYALELGNAINVNHQQHIIHEFRDVKAESNCCINGKRLGMLKNIFELNRIESSRNLPN